MPFGWKSRIGLKSNKSVYSLTMLNGSVAIFVVLFQAKYKTHKISKRGICFFSYFLSQIIQILFFLFSQNANYVRWYICVCVCVCACVWAWAFKMMHTSQQIRGRAAAKALFIVKACTTLLHDFRFCLWKII
jgi:hypothetical protein